MNDSDIPKSRRSALLTTSQRRKSYAARKKLQVALGNLEKDLAHATRDARIVLDILREYPSLLTLIGPEDLDRWNYPLMELQGALDDLIGTFASLGRS